PRYLLELTSGAAGHIASRFPEAAQVLDACHGHPRLGLCVDTCHLHAAGYRMSGAEGVRELLEEMEREVGGSRLGLIHANDSLDPRGSGRDRHWHLGKGLIGREGFRALVSHPWMEEVPIVCETPGDAAADRRNIRFLKRLRLAGR
ncbi:MAG: TIM barrel protein, partial [Actinomycetota bacterium]